MKMSCNRIELTKTEFLAYRAKLIETFKAFDKFCEEHNLTYYAGGGTLIGAVRHQGIIPWDDDIDVLMLKPDYDRFLALKKQCKGTGYNILDYHDKGYYLPFAKFVDSNTSIWEMSQQQFVIGSFVDVFPLCITDDNEEENQYKVDCYKTLFNNYSNGIKSYYLKDESTLKRDIF